MSWLAAWLTLCAFPSRLPRDSGLGRFQRRSQLRGSNGFDPPPWSRRAHGSDRFPWRSPGRDRSASPIQMSRRVSSCRLRLRHITDSVAIYSPNTGRSQASRRRPTTLESTPLHGGAHREPLSAQPSRSSASEAEYRPLPRGRGLRRTAVERNCAARRSGWVRASHRPPARLMPQSPRTAQCTVSGLPTPKTAGASRSGMPPQVVPASDSKSP